MPDSTVDPYDQFLRSLPTDTPAQSAAPTSNADVDTYRVVVATDWTNVTLLVTVARAYAAIIPEGAPVSFVVSVPTSADGDRPDLADAARLDVLLSEAAPDGGVRAELESFEQTGRRPAVVAFVPGGDPHVLISELGRGLTALHHLADHVRTPGAIAAAPPPRQGRMRGLAARLATYSELPGPA